MTAEPIVVAAAPIAVAGVAVEPTVAAGAARSEPAGTEPVELAAEPVELATDPGIVAEPGRLVAGRHQRLAVGPVAEPGLAVGPVAEPGLAVGLVESATAAGASFAAAATIADPGGPFVAVEPTVVAEPAAVGVAVEPVVAAGAARLEPVVVAERLGWRHGWQLERSIVVERVAAERAVAVGVARSGPGQQPTRPRLVVVGQHFWPVVVVGGAVVAGPRFADPGEPSVAG